MNLVKSPLFASIVAALGAFLFGYHTSVISGAVLFLAKDFQLTTFQQELVVSTLMIGALIGAIGGGFIVDLLGRKKILFLTLLLFFIGTFLLAQAININILLIGRFVAGLAVGIVSFAVPLYISEISPPAMRGTFVLINQLAVTMGILIAYIVAFIFSESYAWRPMFSFAYLPATLQLIGLFFIPESPSWTLSQNQKKEAEKILSKIEASPSADVPKETNKRFYAKPLLVGIGINIFQQITGINAVIYYAPRIFQLAGFQSAQTAIFATIFLGAVNMIVTVFALWLIDRVGRKPLLIGGLMGMATALALLGFSFFIEGNLAFIALASLMLYVASFAISLGPVAFLITSEIYSIYPLTTRGRAIGAATFANWGSNYLVALSFLSLIHLLGIGVTFWVFTLISLLGIWFIFTQVPETRGKMSDQIQNFWKK
ncbi:MAG: sugar porter family MFS transporter [Chlamydiota bacterium]